MDMFSLTGLWRLRVVAVFALLLASPARVLAGGEEPFNTPQQAVDALVQAARSQNTNAVRSIFGPEARELISADPVQARAAFASFAERVTNRVVLTNAGPQVMGLEIGYDRWPFPIPLVNAGGRWHFDTDSGRQEILNRRIGRNELAVIDVCHAYVEAQRDYETEPRQGDEILEYAEHLRSTPGKRDGLYWHAAPGEEASPFGPLISEAHAEGYQHESKILAEPQNPYHGYLFRILTRQGPHAPGGKYSYVINGHMVAGFALIAWPAQWGNTGVMTFIVNQENKVFQKNLGPETARLAPKIKSFDPDPSWRPADSQ